MMDRYMENSRSYAIVSIDIRDSKAMEKYNRSVADTFSKIFGPTAFSLLEISLFPHYEVIRWLNQPVVALNYVAWPSLNVILINLQRKSMKQLEDQSELTLICCQIEQGPRFSLHRA